MLSTAAVLLVILQCGNTEDSNAEIKQGVESLRQQLIRDNYDYMYDDINSHRSINISGGGEDENPTGKSEIKEQNTKTYDSKEKSDEISIAKERLEITKIIDKSTHEPKSDPETNGRRVNRNDISISKTYDGKTSKTLFLDIDQTKEKNQRVENMKESLQLIRRIPQRKKGKSEQVIRVEDSNRIIRKKKHNFGNNTKRKNQSVGHSKESFQTESLNSVITIEDGSGNSREKQHNIVESEESKPYLHKDSKPDKTRRSNRVVEEDRSLKENKTEADILDKLAISNKYLATSKYTILREKNPSRRKDAQTFVQEEAIDGVVIASLDRGLVPPLLLPSGRRQYMEAYGAVISEEEEEAPPPDTKA